MWWRKLWVLHLESCVRLFISGVGKPTANRQGQRAPGKSVCCERLRWLLWTAALAALCQGLLAAAAQSLQRGQGSPGSFLSHGSWWVSEFPGWLSVNPSILHLTELFGGNVLVNDSHTCCTWAWLWLGVLGLLVLKWRGNPSFQMAASSFRRAAPSSSHLALCSDEGESTGWSELFSPPPVYGVWPFSSQLGPRNVLSSLRWQITEEQ